jgi:Ras-related C3 botulinum toxin substrate 1
MSQEISRTLNCVLLGDAGVGKSSLLIVYTINEFPGEFVPTIFENYQKNVSVGIEVISVIFDDSANLMKRPDSSTHDKADAFLLCYAVNDAHSLENIKEKWFGEIKHLSPNVPIILVGTKCDLRDSQAAKEQESTTGKSFFVSQEDANSVGKEIGAVEVLECSASTKVGFEEVFDKLIHHALQKPQAKQGGCILQ